jgi:hypothetical protein
MGRPVQWLDTTALAVALQRREVGPAPVKQSPGITHSDDPSVQADEAAADADANVPADVLRSYHGLLWVIGVNSRHSINRANTARQAIRQAVS